MDEQSTWKGSAVASKLIWFDVSAYDTNAVRGFYSKLFGWRIGPDRSGSKHAGWIMDETNRGPA